VPDTEYTIKPPEGRFQWNTRLTQLERLADEFWPGNDDSTKFLRNWIVWCQFERECPWDSFTEFDPERDPVLSEPEAIAEICTCDLQPALGGFVSGLGDNVRAELRRQGRSLEELCSTLKPTRERIPWDALPPAEYRRDHLESAAIKREIRRQYPKRP
jgi:hypothetical protein